MYSLDPLYDAVWALVFECLNLNERRAVRLACKRFKELCDRIKIDKLVIFDRVAPIGGRLQHTNEPFGLEHTAYVANLRKFFNNNQIVAKQMKSIRALVIRGNYGLGDSGEEVDLKCTFDQLEYLDIKLVNFLSPTILSSSKLEYLILHSVNLRPPELITVTARASWRDPTVSVAWYALGFDELQSRRLKHLKITPGVNRALLYNAIQSQHFNCLEDADLWLSDLNEIQFLVARGNFPKLRRLNVMMNADQPFDQFVSRIGALDLNKFYGTAREDLTVYLYGMPLSSQHKSAFVDFLKPFAGKINTANHSPLFTLTHFDRRIYQHIEKWNETQDLDQFCKMIGDIFFHSAEQLTLDKTIFKKFTQCRGIVFPANPNPIDFGGYLDALASLNLVWLKCEFDQSPLYGNQLLDLIAEKCPQLNELIFESWEKIEFDFLFKMPRLRHLSMLLAHPFPQGLLMDLLQKQRDLIRLNVFSVNSNGESSAELSVFKKRVIETFGARFKARKLGFRIEIHTVKAPTASLKDGSKANQFLRYALKEDYKPLIKNAVNDINEKRMFHFLTQCREKCCLNKQA